MFRQNKRYFLGSVLFISIIAVLITVNKYNPYLRTDVFRSFAQGNWYMVSEQDTLFTMGYHGVRKYLLNDSTDIKLLNSNNFCKNRLFGRSGCVYNDYLYVATRSFLPGPVESTKPNGKLLIVNKNNLEIVKELYFDIKLVEAKVYRDVLWVSGIKGFFCFDISNPIEPKPIFVHKSKNYREYQGFDFFQKDSSFYAAFALFGEGLEVWDITNPATSSSVCSIPISEPMNDGTVLENGQSLDIVADYPYVYAPVGPVSKWFKTVKDSRGLLVYDVSDLQNVTKQFVSIPKSYWYNISTGDKQPTYVTKFGDYVITNFAEQGVAVFDTKDKNTPSFLGVVDISKRNALIQPIHTSKKGVLFAGHYFWKTVFSCPIDELILNLKKNE